MIRIVSLSMVLVFLSSCAVFQRPETVDRAEFTRLNPEAQVVVTTWLQKECEARALIKMQAQLVDFEDHLEAVFWESYRWGPTKQELDAFSAQAAVRYERRQSWLRESGSELLSSDDLARQLDTSSRQYVKRNTERYIAGYKSRSLAGIGYVGTLESLERLCGIAANGDNPDQTAALEALRTLLEQLEN